MSMYHPFAPWVLTSYATRRARPNLRSLTSSIVKGSAATNRGTLRADTTRMTSSLTNLWNWLKFSQPYCLTFRSGPYD